MQAPSDRRFGSGSEAWWHETEGYVNSLTTIRENRHDETPPNPYVQIHRFQSQWRKFSNTMNDNLLPYQNRIEAGRVLAKCLKSYKDTAHLLVLHLPRAAEIGYEVAKALDADLDVLVVRKLEVPGLENIPMGAIAGGSVTIRHRDVLSSQRIPLDTFKRTAHRERGKLYRRELAYRGARPFPELDGCCVILVDVGLETGSMMQTAIKSARFLGAERIVVAVPVAPLDTLQSLRDLADDLVCPVVLSDFESIVSYYLDFPGVDDVDVVRALHKRARKYIDNQSAN